MENTPNLRHTKVSNRREKYVRMPALPKENHFRVESIVTAL
jgi:hypothetical protein